MKKSNILVIRNSWCTGKKIQTKINKKEIKKEEKMSVQDSTKLWGLLSLFLYFFESE